MTVEDPEPIDDYAWLMAKAQVKELPFTSNTAFVGGLISRFREFWNSISTKWYIRPLIQQQNEFNNLIVSAIREHDAWSISMDREQTILTRNTAELTTQLIQMNRRLKSIEERLSRLEAHQ